MATLRGGMTAALAKHGETWEDLEYIAVSSRDELDRDYYDGFGIENGPPFTAWTRKRVYFPATYDGSEWIESVPRHPCDTATLHVGG